MGRPKKVVDTDDGGDEHYRKPQGYRPRIHSRVKTKIVIPQEVLDLQSRRNALTPSSTTAAFFGDPLPGESALDRLHDEKPEEIAKVRHVRTWLRITGVTYAKNNGQRDDDDDEE